MNGKRFGLIEEVKIGGKEFERRRERGRKEGEREGERKRDREGGERGRERELVGSVRKRMRERGG